MLEKWLIAAALAIPGGQPCHVEDPGAGLLPADARDTLWLFNIAMGNGPFIDCLPIMVIFHGYVEITRWYMILLCHVFMASYACKGL